MKKRKKLLQTGKEQLMEEIRLQKFMAESGIASRRKCEEYILRGYVKVNGKVVTQLGTKIKPGKDKIEYKETIIQPVKDEKIYILLNKPIRLCNY